jgi:isopropylmalate/homocitrate/citramalate synthase
MGVARIEAGFPRVSPEDAIAIQMMQKAGIKAELWGFSRAVAADIEEIARLEMPATVIESPTSDIKLKAYGMTRDEVLRRVTSAIQFAAERNITVAYFTVDGTRTELDFLRKIYTEALNAGAKELVVVDTIGVCGPEAVEFLVHEVCGWFPGVPIHFHGHNDFGLGTACAIAAVRGGASWIQGTLNGMGERAGNADIAEIALALQCLYDVPVEMNLAKVRAASRVAQRAGGYSVDAWKPLVGENLFTRESGAVASQFHIPEAIEPYSAELVNAPRRIVLGKKSGLDSITLKAQELGLSIADEQRGAILAEVKKRATAKGGLLTDEEFLQLVQQ